MLRDCFSLGFSLGFSMHSQAGAWERIKAGAWERISNEFPQITLIISALGLAK